MEKIFVLGGCKSGKSAYALDLADSYPGDKKIFIATCVPEDDEMRLRVKNHQEERGSHWETVECPVDLPEIIPECGKRAQVMLVDCLTLWASNVMFRENDNDAVLKRIGELVDALNRTQCRVVLVSNEVGMGIVPENALARRYRDVVGRINQAVAKACDKAFLVVAGLPMALK